MSALTKAWIGVALIGAGAAIYAVKGLPSGWDVLWHGGMFALGGMLLVPARWSVIVVKVVDAVRWIFGKPPVSMP